MIEVKQRSQRVLVGFALFTLLVAPVPARAEGFISPFVGGVFANQPVEGDVAFGFDADYMTGGIFGFEFDLGYQPDIFGEPVDNYALTAMGNLILGIPVGGTGGPGVRPYVTGGVGLMRTDFGGLLDNATNDFGINVGGGVMGFFGDHFGLRGDLRYIRNVSTDLTDADFDPEFEFGDIDFWRATVGIVIR